MIKPTNIDKLQEKLGNFQAETIEVVNDLDQVIIDMAIDKGKDFAVRAGAKHAAALGCTVFSSAGTAVCEAAMLVYNVGDGLYTGITGAMDVYE